MYNGPQSSHTDSGAPEQAPNEGNYTAPISYAPFPSKDGYGSADRKYGPIEERGREITISSPVDEVETLLLRTHLTAQLHVENKDHWNETEYTNNGGRLYDEAILDLYEEKLELEGITPSQLDIPERRLKTIFLRLAREQNGKELWAYLAGSDPVDTAVHTLLGYKGPADIPSYNTLQRDFRKLNDSNEIDTEAFEAAVTRAVYASYRAGIVPPDAVTRAYNFDAVRPPLDERNIPNGTRMAELRDWIKLLMEYTLEPLTFGRTDDKIGHDMQRFVGALAASALFGCGVEEVKDVCRWDYPREHIPGGSWLYNYVSERLPYGSDLDGYNPESDMVLVPSLNQQFTGVHARTLSLAKECGFWSQSNPLNVAADMFRVDWTGDSLEATVGRPPKADNEAVTQQWTFLLAGGIDTESRFLFGGRLVENLSSYPAMLDEILSEVSDIINIDTIFVDSEIVSGDLITTLRGFAGSDWVASAPDRAIIKGLKRLTPRGYIGFAPGVKWNTNPVPNVVTYPYNGDDPDLLQINPDDVSTDKIRNETEKETISVPLSTAQQRPLPDNSIPMLTDAVSDLAEQDGVGNQATHAAYLTDRSLQDHSGAGIRYPYLKRWSIEVTINQIVNDFMPNIKSGDKKQRLYGLHIAILFYNWHTFVNRCLSPRGLRFDISATELLQVVRSIAFEPQ